jgi:hypothetical protein
MVVSTVVFWGDTPVVLPRSTIHVHDPPEDAQTTEEYIEREGELEKANKEKAVHNGPTILNISSDIPVDCLAPTTETNS